jgi:hypothetical protein
VDSSAKLSAFLAMGCLSPRTVHAEVMRLQAAEEQLEQQLEQQQQQQPSQPQGQGQEQEQQHVQRQAQQEQAESAGEQAAGSATSAPGWREPQRGDTWRWLLMHLATRDFFTYTALKEGEGEPAWCAPAATAAAPAKLAFTALKEGEGEPAWCTPVANAAAPAKAAPSAAGLLWMH